MPFALPAGLPPPPLGSETGLSDLDFVDWCRDAMEDYPLYEQEQISGDAVTGQLGPNSVPFLVAQAPIYDNLRFQLGLQPSLPAPIRVALIIGGNLQSDKNVVYDPQASLAANDVLVRNDTGELIFGTVPPLNSTVTWRYQRVRWTDNSILLNLHAGLRTMSLKEVFKTHTDTSVKLQVLQYDYALPAWCLDPRSRIDRVEVIRILTPGEDYHEITDYERVGLDRIHVPQAQRWAPTGVLRIHGEGPYLALGDLEPELVHLPVLYALGMMMGKREIKRSRLGQQVPVKDSGSPLPTQQMQIGKHFMDLFWQELKERSRVNATQGRGRIRAPRYAGFGPYR